MITRENLKQTIDDLDYDQVVNAIDGDGEYVLIRDTGYYPVIESYDYDENVDQAAANSGNLFCDKGTFLNLASKCETTNPAILNYL